MSGIELRMAALSGQNATVKDLIEQGVDVNNQSFDGWTALLNATSRGHVSTVALLLQYGADANICATDGASPLSYAVIRRFADIVRLLLDHGASIRRRGDHGQELMRFARDKKEISLLLKNAGALEEQTKTGVEQEEIEVLAGKGWGNPDYIICPACGSQVIVQRFSFGGISAIQCDDGCINIRYLPPGHEQRSNRHSPEGNKK